MTHNPSEAGRQASSSPMHYLTLVRDNTPPYLCTMMMQIHARTHARPEKRRLQWFAILNEADPFPDQSRGVGSGAERIDTSRRGCLVLVLIYLGGLFCDQDLPFPA